MRNIAVAAAHRWCHLESEGSNAGNGVNPTGRFFCWILFFDKKSWTVKLLVSAPVAQLLSGWLLPSSCAPVFAQMHQPMTVRLITGPTFCTICLPASILASCVGYSVCVTAWSVHRCLEISLYPCFFSAVLKFAAGVMNSIR